MSSLLKLNQIFVTTEQRRYPLSLRRQFPRRIQLVEKLCTRLTLQNKQRPFSPLIAFYHSNRARPPSILSDVTAATQFSPTSLLGLPTELLLMIGNCVQGLGTLSNLVRAHTKLACVLSSVLYEKAFREIYHPCINDNAGHGRRRPHKMDKTDKMDKMGKMVTLGGGKAGLLEWSAKTLNLSLLYTLIDVYDADMESPGFHNDPQMADSVLHIIAGLGDVSACQSLIERGVGVNARGKLNRTPLHYASKENRPDIIEFLVEKGAKLEVLDDNGQTPLLTAIEHGAVDAMRALLAHGADPNKRVRLFTRRRVIYSESTQYELTPLLMAVWPAPRRAPLVEEMIRMLVQYGADLDEPTRRYSSCGTETPLACLAEKLSIRFSFPETQEYLSCINIIRLLLELGANIEPALEYIKSRMVWRLRNGVCEGIRIQLENALESAQALHSMHVADDHESGPDLAT